MIDMGVKHYSMEEHNAKIKELPIESFIKMLFLHYTNEIEKLEQIARESRDCHIKSMSEGEGYWLISSIEKFEREQRELTNEITRFMTLKGVVSNLIEKYKLSEDNQHTVDELKRFIRY